jgi:hypothetical protein
LGFAGLIAYLCTINNSIQKANDKLLDGQAASLAQAKDNRDGIDQIFNMVSSHETYMKANSKFNQEVANRLNIQNVPVFVPIDERPIKTDWGKK